jgi:hypothetical protein
MTIFKRLLNLLALFLGFIGLVGCFALVVGVWIISARLSQVTENLFGKLDGSLVVVRERVAQTHDRVEASKITTEGIEKTLKDWTKREADERLALRLNAAEKTERLASTLQQADHWLEVSESSVELVQQALSMGSLAGAPMDTTSVDGLIEEIASFRSQLAEATEFVARIHERTAEASEEKSLEERIEQAVQLALRVVATLGSIDSRLEKFENRLSETQKNLQGLKTKTRRWILVVTIGITLLMVWMAAGQVALCLLAWNGLRRTGRPPDEEKPSPQSAGEGSE